MDVAVDTSRSGPRSRVLAIGVDAAEPWLVEEMIADGSLPSLSALRDSGRFAHLENQRAYRSEALWTAFTTGQGPESNGYWTNVGFDPSTYDVFDMGASGLPGFWSGPDRGRSIIFDVPHTTIRDDDDAVICTGWGCHSPLYPRASNPPGLLAEIDERFGPHPAWGADETSCWFDADYLAQLEAALLAGPAARGRVLRWLWDRYPDWQFTLTVFSETHSAGHHGWHGIDTTHPAAAAPTAAAAGAMVRSVLRAVDAEVGELVRAAPHGTTVVVFSLHGMRGNTNDVPSLVLLPELLARLSLGQEFLVERDVDAWEERGYLLPRFSWGQELAVRYREGGVHDLMATALDRLPPRLSTAALDVRHRLTGSAPPHDRFHIGEVPHESRPPQGSFVRSLDWQPTVHYRPHWPAMTAFALPTFSDAHVRLNVVGREARGIVALEDYDVVLDRLIEELHTTVDVRTGKPAVDDVDTPRRKDPLSLSGPPSDLIVYWNPGIEAIEHPTAGRIGPVPFLRTGEHTSNGFCLVAGEGQEAGSAGDVPVASLYATIHELLGWGHSQQGPSILSGVS
jgi:predicted AlkP superfamily phosphohydrolase/phosphomutase